MQRGVRVFLATVWLVVSLDVLGAATRQPSYLTFDQYSPLTPSDNDRAYSPVEEQLDWKDQDPAEDQPLDLSIGPRSSISRNQPPRHSQFKFAEEFSSEEKPSEDFAGTKFRKGRNGHRSAKESFPREIPLELEDPFVADDTFQDQGPGSVEIYKLDLFKEKSLLNHTPSPRLSRNKSKAPKKTGRFNWKPKSNEYKSTSPKIHHRQSNFFDEVRTEVPPNSETFGVGGVPELQVGCEGLEASFHKLKRSIDSKTKENPWPNVTPISLDLDYDFSSEETYEEMDELLKLKKLESTTKKPKQNRGDMEATSNSEDFLEEIPDKLPVRGDLGKSNNKNESSFPASLIREQKSDEKNSVPVRSKREVSLKRRKLLSFENEETGRGSKPRVWGFGEDEGVVASDELETENQRRRQHYERQRLERERKRNETEREINRIREEYEKMLEHTRRQEEERMRRRQEKENHRTRSRIGEEELRRYEDELRRRQRLQEELRRREESRIQEEKIRRQQEMLRRRQEEDQRKRNEAPSNLLQRHHPTQNHTKSVQEEKLREYIQRNQPVHISREPSYRRSEDDRRRQEEERRRLEEERKLQEYIRRNQPVHVSRTNASHGRSWYENRRIIDEARQYDRYPATNERRIHGPSPQTYVSPRNNDEEARRREEIKRLEERKRQEELRRETLRREEEYRRLQSRRYEEERRRLEAQAMAAERRRKEMIQEQERRIQARTRPQEPRYEDRRLVQEHRRHETDLAPGNLVLDESRRVLERERQRQEQERRRIEAQRRRQEEIRMQEARLKEEQARGMSEQRRRQEEARLNALPVSARIILRSRVSPSNSPPSIFSRTNFANEIDFLGINPTRSGVKVSKFPVPPTVRPPIVSPGPCVWAVLQCCSNNNRVVTCFESMGCPGVNWDPNPCRDSIADAAREEVMKFYSAAEENGSH